MSTQAKKHNGGIVSASDILKAGGPNAWAKKNGYKSKDVKMSGIITLSDKQLKEALKSVD